MDGGFPAVSRSLRDLESEITALTGHLNAATHRWLTLVAEFDTRKGWAESWSVTSVEPGKPRSSPGKLSSKPIDTSAIRSMTMVR